MNDVISMIGTLSDKSWWVSLICGAIMVGYIGLVVYRTGSVYALMDLAWRLFSKRDVDGESEIAKYMLERSEFMRFRFSTGLRVRTLQKAKELIAWAKDNGEDLGEVAACGKYFDLELVGLKNESELPKKWEMKYRAFVMILLVILAYGAILGGVYGRAVITINASGTFVYATTENASPTPVDFPWEKQIFLRKEDCKSATRSAAFSEPDAKVVCELLVGNTGNSFVANAIKGQRYLFGFFLCMLLIFGFIAWRWLQAAVIVRMMKKRLDSKLDGKPDQRELNNP